VIPGAEAVRSVHGNNADLLAAAVRLYVATGAKVLDATWGHGVFWRRFGANKRFTLIGSDIRRLPNIAVVADLRALPFAADSFDTVVLDPPYVHTGPGHHYLDHRYGNTATTPVHSHADIVALYAAGMREARHVLKIGGILMVKCADEIESGRQRWTHIEIHAIAREQGYRDRDLLVLVPPPIKTKRWRVQWFSITPASHTPTCGYSSVPIELTSTPAVPLPLQERNILRHRL
jgi:hypothetical protein